MAGMYEGDPLRVQGLYNPSRGGFGSLATPQMPAMPAPTGMTEQKPGAFGKGGWAWKLMGVLGDSITEGNGGKGTFMPAFLDMQEQTRKERETQRKLAEQAQALMGLNLTPQQQAAVQAGVANYSDFKPSNAQPYRWEDNAGNVWERGADGTNQRIFTDETPKYYVQGDKAIRIANPYLSGGSVGSSADDTPTVEDGHQYTPGPGGRANPGNWKPVGGAASNGGGNFR